MSIVLLGTGRLTWHRSERVSDRYGTVFLMDGDEDSWRDNSWTYVPFDDAPIGQHGELYVEIVETRASLHIGDIFRGLYPSTPKVGEVINLGTGTLFREAPDADDPGAIGLKPDEPRLNDWLDPKALYRCHDQTVRLFFEET